MNLRRHLHAWLFPRDPLLEAWKDDPFVEAMVEREGKVQWRPGGVIAPILLQRWGCGSVFVASVVVYGSLLEVQRSLNRYWIDGLTAIALSVGFVLLARQGLIVFGNQFRRSANSGAPMEVLVQSTGQNPLLLELWMSGVRGRDLVKALHVVLCSKPMKLWPSLVLGSVCLSLILAWEPTTHIGGAGFAIYVLLAIWFRLVSVYFRYGRYNPLTSVSDRFHGTPPKFICPAWEVAKAPSNVYSTPVLWPVVSAVLTLFTLLLALIIGYLYEVALMEPIKIFGLQVIFLLLACLIVLSHRLGPGAHFHERLEDALHIADLEFDLHIRRHIIQDPDAERPS